MLKPKEIFSVISVLAYTTVALGLVSIDLSSNSSYTWEFQNSRVWQITLLGIVCASIALFSHHWKEDVKKWAKILAVVGGFIPVYWAHVSAEDADSWMIRQMAVDAPSFLEGEKYNLYWNSYTENLGDVNAFGGIQTLYERFGPNVTLNDNTIFLNVINNASIESVENILETVDTEPIPFAIGFYLSLLAYFSLIVALYFVKSSVTKIDAPD